MEAAFLSESPDNRQNVVEIGFLEKCQTRLRLPLPAGVELPPSLSLRVSRSRPRRGTIASVAAPPYPCYNLRLIGRSP